MDFQHLLFKYMQHLHKMEESLFLELVNTPFSEVHFTDEEIEALRTMEDVIENAASLSGQNQS